MAAFLLPGAWGTLFAQDIITLKNGEDLKAKILEVLSNEIKYKRYDNMDGRDMRGIASNVEFRVAPWVGPAPGIDGNFRTSAGLALTMNF